MPTQATQPKHTHTLQMDSLETFAQYSYCKWVAELVLGSRFKSLASINLSTFIRFTWAKLLNRFLNKPKYNDIILEGC